MTELFEVFVETIEGGSRTYEDGSEFVEIRFADSEGRTAAILARPSALALLADRIQALIAADGKPH